MIEEVAPDAVYVIGPPDVMYPHWIWCLEHGLNLYIEKPMGITLHQARNLAYLAREARLHHPGELPAPHLPDGGASCATNA